MKIKKYTKKAKEFEKKVQDRLFTAIAAAFALVIALSWNEAIKGTVQKFIEYVGIMGEGYLIKIIVAVITTVICVLGIVIASRFNSEKD